MPQSNQQSKESMPASPTTADLPSASPCNGHTSDAPPASLCASDSHYIDLKFSDQTSDFHPPVNDPHAGQLSLQNIVIDPRPIDISPSKLLKMTQSSLRQLWENGCEVSDRPPADLDASQSAPVSSARFSLHNIAMDPRTIAISPSKLPKMTQSSLRELWENGGEISDRPPADLDAPKSAPAFCPHTFNPPTSYSAAYPKSTTCPPASCSSDFDPQTSCPPTRPPSVCCPQDCNTPAYCHSTSTTSDFPPLSKPPQISNGQSSDFGVSKPAPAYCPPMVCPSNSCLSPCPPSNNYPLAFGPPVCDRLVTCYPSCTSPNCSPPNYYPPSNCLPANCIPSNCLSTYYPTTCDPPVSCLPTCPPSACYPLGHCPPPPGRCIPSCPPKCCRP